MTVTHTGNSVIAPFTVLVDHRERSAAYRFTRIPCGKRYPGKVWQVPTKVLYVKTGDYTIEGMEDQVTIERKTLPDLFKTLGKGRRQFKDEINRMLAMDFAAIVIEADLREAWRPRESRPGWRSRLAPRSVEGTIVSWSIRYPSVHWWFCGSRRMAEVRTFLALEMFYRLKKHERKQAQK